MFAITCRKETPSDHYRENYFLCNPEDWGWTPLPDEAFTFLTRELANNFIREKNVTRGNYGVEDVEIVSEFYKYNRTWRFPVKKVKG